MSVEVGSLYSSLRLDDSQFNKGIGNAQKGMQKLGGRLSSVGGSMTKFVTGPIMALAGGMTMLAKKTGEYADEILDMAAATGHSTDAIQEYQAVAERAGVATDAFTNASQTLTQQMTRSAGGSASMQEGLEKLGLTFEQLEQASPDERMEILMERLRGIEDAGERAMVGTQVLRGGYEDLAPILGMTAEEMDKVIDRAHESGKIMDGEALENADKFRQGLDELKQEFTAMARTIANEIIPVMNDTLIPMIQDTIMPMIISFASLLGDIAGAFGALPTPVQKFAVALTAILAAAGPVLMIIGKLITLKAALVPVIATVGAALGAFAAGPLIAVAAAVIAVIAVFKRWDEIVTFVRNFIDVLVDAFGFLREAITGAFQGIYDNTIGIFEGLWNGIKRILNAIIGGVNRMIDGLNRFSIDVPNWVPGNISSFGFNISQIPTLQHGGNIEVAGAALVGEREPEIVDLPRGARVTPLSQAGDMGGGGDTVINIRHASMRSEDDIETLARKLDKRQAARARRP